ncbi:MAG: hypothetical protein R1F52_00755 [Candidatus Nitrosoabyssus spongiisocia]|nr:MAG: hypothetical protein R1F52_00755 [Nitrosopumilaceae archaeon AB1(1)]
MVYLFSPFLICVCVSLVFIISIVFFDDIHPYWNFIGILTTGLVTLGIYNYTKSNDLKEKNYKNACQLHDEVKDFSKKFGFNYVSSKSKNNIIMLKEHTAAYDSLKSSNEISNIDISLQRKLISFYDDIEKKEYDTAQLKISDIIEKLCEFINKNKPRCILCIQY